MNDKTESFSLVAGGLAHDYNNLLTAMLGNLDLVLADGTLGGDTREAVTDVRASVVRAADLVRRIFAYIGDSEPALEQVELGAQLGDLARLMRRAIPDNIRIELKTEDSPSVMADSTQLWRVVMNLVVNARDAIGDSAGTISISCATLNSIAGIKCIFAPSAKSGRWAAIKVADDGPGIDAATVRRIFDPHFTTKKDGNGLGLASVLSIVKSYGGSIALETAPGKGAAFTVILPCEGSAQEGGATATDNASAEQDGGMSADNAIVEDKPSVKTLLVVDDDASILKLLGIILRSGGYAVVTASSGAEGLAAYEKTPELFSLALVDASMGLDMDGIELCSEIRKRNADIPLVLMSAYRAKEMAGRMAEAGITKFLAKPFRGNDVLEMISSLADDGRTGRK